MPRIVFSTPLSALDGSPVTSPRFLRDARLKRLNRVSPERDGSVGDDLPGVPVVRVGDVLLDTELTDLGDAAFSALHAATRAGDRTIGAVTETARKVAAFTDDGAGGVDADVEIPHVVGTLSHSNVNAHNFGLGFTTLNRYSLIYAILPFNKRDECGDPYYVGAYKFGLTTSSEGAEIPGSEQALDWVIPVSDDTSYVEVYKSYSFGEFGYARSQDNTDTGTNPVGASTDTVWFFKRVQATEQGGQRQVEFRDDVSFWSEAGLALTGPTPLEEGRVISADTTLNEIRIPTEALSRPINVHVKGTYGSVTYPGAFTANALHYAGGKVFYGDVAWRTKPVRPSIADDHFSFATDGGGNTGTYDVRVRREYVVGGRTVTGPARTFSNINRLKVAWQGESALLVEVDGGSGFQHYERLVPDGQGAYVTSYPVEVQQDPLPAPKTPLGSEPPYYAFSGPSFDASRLTTLTYPDEVAYIEEPLSVFRSNVLRPREILLEAVFSLPHGDRVRMLAPARQAEIEGLKSYDFIAASSTGVWVVENTEGYPLTAVTEAFGVAVSSLTDRPMYAPVHQGLVVVGTDGGIHLVSGRQAVPLDTDVVGLWSEVYDVTYDPIGEEKEPLLWALTDSGLWAYSFLRSGWVAHRSADDGRWVFFDDVLGLLVGGAGESVEVVDGSGAARTARVVTQYLLEEPPTTPGLPLTEPRVKVRSVAADFGSGVFDPAETAELLWSIRHPDVVSLDPQEASGGSREGRSTVAANRPRYPRFAGLGWLFGLEGWSGDFRAFNFTVEG